MCRIAGIASRAHCDNGHLLTKMLSSLAHGGPDDEGIYQDEKIAFGHRRLAIIDLSSAGHQPMGDDDGLVVSFNGEIYNYQSLRNELQGLGLVFKTRTDTEVILQAYRQWGVKAFDRFQGIFAFSLYDKAKNRVLLVRDHLGIKPLYYFLDFQELIFASEVKAFKALRPDWEENEDWKTLFLAFGAIPHPFTTLTGVNSLPPGSYLELSLTTFEHRIKYFYQVSEFDYKIHSTAEALTRIGIASRNALEKNLISDAPLGIFLSGGIDSSLLTLLADQVATNINTISVNFDDASFDESHFQKMVLDRTKNTRHTSYKVTERMFWDQLGDVWHAMDQPSIDGINSYFVTRCARGAGIKAVLSGLGADEIFGGYSSFKRVRWLRRLRQLPFTDAIARFLSVFKNSWGRLVYLSLPGGIGDYLFLRGIYTPNEISSQLNIPIDKVWSILSKVSVELPKRMNDVEYASLLETKIYMTNQLLKDTDYMGMWHGVEVRVPFLDMELVREVHAIPPWIRYKRAWPKYLLTASNRDVLPSEIVFRKKLGFTFPFTLWLSRSSERFKALLPTTNSADRVWNEFLQGRCHWSKCWSLAVLEQFKYH